MKFAALALLLALAACASGGRTYVLPAEPTIGAALPVAAGDSFDYPTHGAQLQPAWEVAFERIHYIVTVDRDRKINYIETNDRKFKTREGLTVGNTLDDVLAAGGAPPVEEPGWGHYSVLQSGWSAILLQDTNSPSDPLRVVSFFRRDAPPVDQSRAH